MAWPYQFSIECHILYSIIELQASEKNGRRLGKVMQIYKLQICNWESLVTIMPGEKKSQTKTKSRRNTHMEQY